MKTSYTREKLVALCERAIVDEEKWSNRDSAAAQKQIGICWALLKAGGDFRIDEDETSGRTIWLDVSYCGFTSFEEGPDAKKEEMRLYLPTALRLKAANGKDWYRWP